MNLVFVDCEAHGPCPSQGTLTEFAAVLNRSTTFYRKLWDTIPDKDTPAIPIPQKQIYDEQKAFQEFEQWIKTFCNKPTFISDNPAYDWQWINDGFHRSIGYNPFGFSARRIGDFYAGLCRDFSKSNDWKRLRITKHTHNPLDDAMGNYEAFQRILKHEQL